MEYIRYKTKRIFQFKHVVEAYRGAAALACDYKRDRSWVRFSLEYMKYLIISFPHSVDKAKCGVVTHHLTCYASEFVGKWGIKLSCCQLSVLILGCHILSTCIFDIKMEKREFLNKILFAPTAVCGIQRENKIHIYFLLQATLDGPYLGSMKNFITVLLYEC